MLLQFKYAREGLSLPPPQRSKNLSLFFEEAAAARRAIYCQRKESHMVLKKFYSGKRRGKEKKILIAEFPCVRNNYTIAL